MKITSRFWPHSWQWPIVPLLLIIAINVASFFAFPAVGATVGAATGTDGYKEIAESLAQGHGFVFATGMRSTGMLGYMKREPVYPLWLSVILRITGTLDTPVLWIFQTSLSLVSCCLLSFLGTKVFDAKTATLASYIYALHPISFWYSTRFASEITAVPMFLICLITIERFFVLPTYTKAVQVGLLIGITALAKSAYVILLPLTLLFAPYHWRGKLQRVSTVLVIVMLCYATVHSLWLVRNYRIGWEIVPFTTMNGYSFFVGNRIVDKFDLKSLTAGADPDRWGVTLYQSVQNEISAARPDISLPRLEAQTDKRLIAMAAQWVSSEPWFALQKVFAGLIFLWFLSDTTAKSWGLLMWQAPLLALAAIGLWRQRQWTVSKRFLLCVAAAYCLCYAFVIPLARYAMSISPIVMLFASHGALSLVKPNRFGSRNA